MLWWRWFREEWFEENWNIRKWYDYKWVIYVKWYKGSKCDFKIWGWEWKFSGFKGIKW